MCVFISQWELRESAPSAPSPALNRCSAAFRALLPPSTSGHPLSLRPLRSPGRAQRSSPRVRSRVLPAGGTPGAGSAAACPSTCPAPLPRPARRLPEQVAPAAPLPQPGPCCPPWSSPRAGCHADARRSANFSPERAERSGAGRRAAKPPRGGPAHPGPAQPDPARPGPAPPPPPPPPLPALSPPAAPSPRLSALPPARLTSAPLQTHGKLRASPPLHPQPIPPSHTPPPPLFNSILLSLSLKSFRSFGSSWRPPPNRFIPFPNFAPRFRLDPVPSRNLRVIISLCDKCCGFPCLRRDIALAFTLASPGELHWSGGCVGGRSSSSAFFASFLLLLLDRVLLLSKKKIKKK